ncbi:MAG: NUDIX domain-containing protein [Candidatus Gracilibacteria bacterium]|nr:NUDIX domain-containing protein [Candidatus Gracilibacteria bacterium]
MEYLDIVDENDNVIGINTRKESYQNQTTNRTVSVIILNSEGKILLQKRASTCSFMPGAWSISAGGHVSSGENYKESAIKELKEELGISCNIDFVDKFYGDRLLINGKYSKFNKSHFFFDSIFKGIYDGEFNFLREDNDEVDDIKFFNFEEIKSLIKSDELIMPFSVYILEKYFLGKN